MTTDEQMDGRLRTAGANWRAASVEQPGGMAQDPAGSDVQELIVAPANSVRSKIIMGLSAAAVVALEIGVALGLSGRDSNGPRPGATGSRAIEQVHWRLASIDGVAGDYGGALFVDRDKIQVNDGCNSGGGSGTVTDTTLEFRDIAMTAMGCLGARGESSGRVDRILVGTVTWSVDNGSLTLTKPGAGTLTYRVTPPTTPVTDPALLVGTWTLNGIEHTTGNSASGSGSSDMGGAVQFDRAGRVTINHRCYIKRGDAGLGNGTIDIRNLTPDLPHRCPANPTQQEANQDREVDGVLTGHVSWAVKDDTLRLTKGSTTLTFDRR
ncbi:MAG TPA: META domain-containing protein [Jatrophihabitans sp.]|nr:META domain-containing protein [Jatrophihabitans sp.]